MINKINFRTSAVNSDPYKDNVRVELLPYDLIFQVGFPMSYFLHDWSLFSKGIRIAYHLSVVNFKHA
jgi:hypothetical protein